MAQTDPGVERLTATLKQTADKAVSDSVEIIVKDLVPLEIIIPVAGTQADIESGKFSLMVSQDNTGKAWAHFYADMASAARHLEQGTWSKAPISSGWISPMPFR